MKRVAFFDFDGTISNQDSFIKFVEFIVGSEEFNKGLIIFFPLLFLYKLRIISDVYVKKVITRYFFKDFSKKEFDDKITKFSLSELNSIIRKEALSRIKYHQENGDKVVIVSASFEDFLKPWCDKNGVSLIGTKLEVKDGYLTGNLASKNCYGVQKVIRIKELYNLEDFSYIYAYGDSSGDKQMLDLADESFYKPFE